MELVVHLYNWYTNIQKCYLKLFNYIEVKHSKSICCFIMINIFNIILHFRYYLPLEKGGPFIWTWIPSTQGCFVPGLVEIGPVVLEKNINIFNIILHFRSYLPLEKGVAIHLNKLESPPPKAALCQVWLKLIQWFWRRRLKCERFTDRRSTDYRRSEKLIWAEKLWLYHQVYYTRLENLMVLYLYTCTNLNHFHPRINCAKFGWNWSGSREDLEVVNVFSLFDKSWKSV